MAGQGQIEQAVGVVGAHPAGDRHDMVLALRIGQVPAVVVGQQEAQRLVPGQLGGAVRRAVGGQVGRRGADHALQRGQLAHHGVLRRAARHAQGQVDLLLGQIDQLVGQQQLAAQPRVLLGQARQQGRDVQTAEGDGGADAQQAVRFVAQVAHRELGGGHAFQRRQGVLMKHLASGGQIQPPRAAFQQARAKGRFQLGDLLADLGARAVQLACRRRHAAGFHRAHKRLPGGQPGQLPLDRRGGPATGGGQTA